MTSLAVCLGLLLSPAAPIEFREGLAIRSVTRAGRTPVFVDSVVGDLAKRGWEGPKVGDTADSPGGDKRTWEAIKADENGTFAGNAIANGYAFWAVESPKTEVRILESTGWGMIYAEGAPRAGDPYGYGYVKLPVKLRQGTNRFLFAAGRGRPSARLTEPPAPAYFNLADPTFPDLVEGQAASPYAGIIVVNATEAPMAGLQIRARIGDGPWTETPIEDPIQPLTFRKVPVSLNSSGTEKPGEVPLTLMLVGPGGMLDFQKSSLRVRTPLQTRKVTFVSRIDGSVQYYAVNPAQTPGDGKALVLTLHGASVEAIGQADAYQGKDWCHIVAPTNRRPYGFDWEEVGRLDAMEVLEHARATLKTDPLQTYLTGHSMGGHGTWTVGYHFPDQWGAIGPCAGWISFFSYGSGPRPTAPNGVAEVLSRASSASDTLLLLTNALSYPIYIHHGDKDDNVPVGEAREMKAQLDKIRHPNVTLHEQPGAGHWFGGESVDWPGIFDLFKTVRRTPPAEKDSVDFTAVNLAASSKAWWVQILQQTRAMAPSRVKFRRTGSRLEGTTENVEAIRFEGAAFPRGVNPRVVLIDGQTVSEPNVLESAPPMTLVKMRGAWVAANSPREEKRPQQMGPFKEILKNSVVFVYGTGGTTEETEANYNLARFHSESFAYRGNSGVRVLSDLAYLDELDRMSKVVYIRKPDVANVLLYGNADSNLGWKRLLGSSPIQVSRKQVRVGGRTYKGADLATFFIRPRAGDDVALVAAVASTGLAGQRVAERIPIFLSGTHLPDWTIFSADMLSKGADGIRAAGYFRNDWGVAANDTAENAPILAGKGAKS